MTERYIGQPIEERLEELEQKIENLYNEAVPRIEALENQLKDDRSINTISFQINSQKIEDLKKNSVAKGFLKIKSKR